MDETRVEGIETRAPVVGIAGGHWDWPSPTPYSHGVRCGAWLFVGGQAALDAHGAVQSRDAAEQRRLVREHLLRVLRAGQATTDDLVKVNTYYCPSAREPGSMLPAAAHSHVPVEALAYPGLTIEIEAIAWCAAAA